MCDFLRNLALDCEQIIQIAIVLLGPDMRVSARLDQLRIDTKMRAGSADAAFQNMRYTQIITDLTEISFATVIHDTGPADDFEVSNPRQLGQKVVLNAIDERPAFLLVAEIFKRQNRDPSCHRMTDKFTFPNVPSDCRS